VWAHDEARMNEGGCDPDGRFWCGSMAYDRKPGSAALYRLDPDRSIRVAMTGVTISNGLEWTPDGSLAYYADTATHQVDVFDYDRDAGLTDRRPFVTMADDERPDGLTVDSTGAVWVAMNGSGTVRRYTPTGVLDGEVRLPTAQVTACTFGGPDLDQLFVTTSREGMAPDDDPIAGSLFRADVGVAGLPVREFAG
jgi:sugar lactone lactonase YvrE